MKDFICFKYFSIIILSSVNIISSLKVLNTPKYLSTKPPSDGFAAIVSSKNVSTSELTICIWVLSFYKENAFFLRESDKRGFRLSVQHSSNYVQIDSVFYRYAFPSNFEWLPDTWAFFCFTLDVRSKIFNIFLNGEMVFEDEQKIKLKDYKIAPNFLQYLQIGDSKDFAGQITELNMWSKVLSQGEVLGLYRCSKIDRDPDILEWDTVQFGSW